MRVVILIALALAAAPLCGAEAGPAAADSLGQAYESPGPSPADAELAPRIVAAGALDAALAIVTDDGVRAGRDRDRPPLRPPIA